jgi:hypothetical protein
MEMSCRDLSRCEPCPIQSSSLDFIDGPAATSAEGLALQRGPNTTERGGARLTRHGAKGGVISRRDADTSCALAGTPRTSVTTSISAFTISCGPRRSGKVTDKR